MLALLCVCSATASRGDEALPPSFQATLFKKIFLYDRTLEGGSKKILVLYADDTAETSQELAKAFSDAGLQAMSVKVSWKTGFSDSALMEKILEAAIIYIQPSMGSAIKDVCIKHKKLSISGVTAMAEKGDAAISIGKKPDGKPKIVVNLKRVKAEGHELASDLLSLATVVD